MSKFWSSEEEQVLIRLYGEGMSYSDMRKESPLLAARYKKSAVSLRDKIFSLQKDRIKNGIPLGELERQLAQDSKYDYMIYQKSFTEGKIATRKRNPFNIKASVSKKAKKEESMKWIKRDLDSKERSSILPEQVNALIDKESKNDFPRFDSERHIDSCGILMGQCIPIEYDDSFCFTGAQKCKCPILCTIRRHQNKFLKRNEWFPLEDVGTVTEYKNLNAPPKDLKGGLNPKTIAPFDSNEFYLEVLCRDPKRKTGVSAQYCKVILTMKKDGSLYHLKNAEFTMRKMEHLSLHTLKKYLYAINCLFETLSLNEKLRLMGYSCGVAREQFCKYYEDLRDRVDKQYETQKKSLNEEKKWVKWEKLEKSLPRAYITCSDQEYLGYLLMIQQQTLRNDYATLKYILEDSGPVYKPVVNSTSKNFDSDSDSSVDTTSDEDDDIDEMEIDDKPYIDSQLNAEPLPELDPFDMNEENYVDFKRGIFVWNKYKTVKTHGKKEVPIKEEVLQELKREAYRKRVQCKNYLFVNNRNTQMTRAEFGVMINNVTERMVGKRVGSTMMRKILTTEARAGDMSYEASIKLADSLMHTVSTSSTIYRKN